MKQATLLPPFLKPGDLLRVIAPSGALKELEVFQKGLEVWKNRGYRVEMGKNWQAREGYLAGSDSLRRQALGEAWQESECKGILCVRGGYGSARLLEDWDWLAWGQDSRKWLIGFSDVTGLLWSLAKVGIAGVHGPVLTSLGEEPDWSKQRLFDLVEGRSLEPLKGKGWYGGKVRGILLPANLTVATHLLNTPIQPDLEGVILALEDVTEAPYRIDRMLTQWRLSGALRGVVGIALGRFSRCEGNPNTQTVAEVLSDRLLSLKIPIVADLPFGHDGVNAALPVGQWVNLDGDQGVLI